MTAVSATNVNNPQRKAVKNPGVQKGCWAENKLGFAPFWWGLYVLPASAWALFRFSTYSPKTCMSLRNSEMSAAVYKSANLSLMYWRPLVKPTLTLWQLGESPAYLCQTDLSKWKIKNWTEKQINTINWFLLDMSKLAVEAIYKLSTSLFNPLTLTRTPKPDPDLWLKVKGLESPSGWTFLQIASYFATLPCQWKDAGYGMISKTHPWHFSPSFSAGGYLAHSLAIMTDAAHLLTDFGSMMVSLFSLWISSRPPTKTMNFGWHRSGQQPRTLLRLEMDGCMDGLTYMWMVGS